MIASPSIFSLAVMVNIIRLVQEDHPEEVIIVPGQLLQLQEYVEQYNQYVE